MRLAGSQGKEVNVLQQVWTLFSASGVGRGKFVFGGTLWAEPQRSSLEMHTPEGYSAQDGI